MVVIVSRLVCKKSVNLRNSAAHHICAMCRDVRSIVGDNGHHVTSFEQIRRRTCCGKPGSRLAACDTVTSVRYLPICAVS
ncbi:glycosyltransferase family 4 protein [Calocera viscosa TUFC12733]|uniref:Glycosyltransferase family 4 protein n=1 Tax=Calocera viscosa (strain TUFC12733) TaxID=1330018 RepID=A0A167ITU5_CALVF|nr:glycosyltransferase family 4 protein [Calocera viscosa TUFC12733]